MKTKILYFSGTGNSLFISKELNSRLEDSNITPISSYRNQKNINLEEDNIVIISPVYFFKLPDLVKDFVNRLQIKKNTQVWGVVTCGGNSGYALNELKNIIEKKGVDFLGGSNVILADNSILSNSGINKIHELNEKALSKIDTLSKYINNGASIGIKDYYTFKNRSMASLMKWGAYSLFHMDKKKCDIKKCNNCGLCIKICPQNKITLKDNYPYWNCRCTECFACINWCPKSAINFGRTITSDKQYTNPKIKLDEIIKQNKEINNENIR